MSIYTCRRVAWDSNNEIGQEEPTCQVGYWHWWAGAPIFLDRILHVPDKKSSMDSEELKNDV